MSDNDTVGASFSIPFVIFKNKKITHAQKFLCASIYNLSFNKNHRCFAKNKFLSDYLLVDERAIRNDLSALLKLGAIIKTSDGKYRQLYVNFDFFGSDESLKLIENNRCEITHNETATTKLTQSSDEALGWAYMEPPAQSKGEIILKEFDKFWEAYPVKVKKSDTRKKFLKLKDSDIEALMSVLDRVVEYHAQDSTKGTFVPNAPHAVTFLNGRRWEDEIYQHSTNAKATTTSYTPTQSRFIRAVQDEDIGILSDYDLAILKRLGLSFNELIERYDRYGVVEILKLALVL